LDPAGRGEGFGLPRSRRITNGAEIRAIIGRGKRSRTAYLDVFVSASPVLRPRAGLVVPRHGRRIVDRNRLKRRLREIVRSEVLPGLDVLAQSYDVLIRARREAYDASFLELKQQLSGWMQREWPRGSSSC
jgi:ribonuclease P protein component